VQDKVPPNRAPRRRKIAKISSPDFFLNPPYNGIDQDGRGLTFK
jgi:hypothetical protein